MSYGEQVALRGHAGIETVAVATGLDLRVTAEEQFLEKLRRGDAMAYERLVAEHSGDVYALLFRLTSDAEEARDLTQETFLRAYKHIRSFRGEARFSTWLYRIAYNCFREEARRRKEFVGIDEKGQQQEPDPQVRDPALRHDLMYALSLLPLHERSAILLCCQNGLTHDEAARVLEIPIGTVKTNVLRGREKLKRALAGWGPN